MKHLIEMIIFGQFPPFRILKKLYITYLQYSYFIKLYFPYDIIYLPNGCEANAITFVLPSNNKLNVEPIIKALEYKLGFTRSYSKINMFSLMQSINISNLTNDKLKLKVLANKIQEMKHVNFQYKQYVNKY